MTKRAKTAEANTNEGTLEIPQQELDANRQECFTTKESLFSQVRDIVIKIEGIQTKEAAKIRADFETLNPMAYKAREDSSTSAVVGILKDEKPASITVMGSEGAIKVFNKLSEEKIDTFLTKPFDSAQLAMDDLNEVAAETNDIFSYYEGFVHKIQQERRKELRAKAEHLLESISVKKTRFSVEMKDNEYYESAIFMFQERARKYAENTIEQNYRLEKEENTYLEQLGKIRQTISSAVLEPYAGIHVYY
jgi:hypothetical protein